MKLGVFIDGVEHVAVGSWEPVQVRNAEISRLKDLLRREQTARSVHITATDTEARRLNSEIDRLRSANDYLETLRSDEVAAWVNARDYWRDKASEYGTALAVSDKAVAIYENAVDCLTAELEHFRMTSWLKPIPYAPVDSLRAELAAAKRVIDGLNSHVNTLIGERDTANEAIKLLGEGFAREVNAANYYAWGLVEVDEYLGRNFFRVECPIRGIIDSARKAGDAARKAPKTFDDLTDADYPLGERVGG